MLTRSLLRAPPPSHMRACENMQDFMLGVCPLCNLIHCKQQFLRAAELSHGQIRKRE